MEQNETKGRGSSAMALVLLASERVGGAVFHSSDMEHATGFILFVAEGLFKKTGRG